MIGCSANAGGDFFLDLYAPVVIGYDIQAVHENISINIFKILTEVVNVGLSSLTTM
jgi:hypothetical protein